MTLSPTVSIAIRKVAHLPTSRHLLPSAENTAVASKSPLTHVDSSLTFSRKLQVFRLKIWRSEIPNRPAEKTSKPLSALRSTVITRADASRPLVGLVSLSCRAAGGFDRSTRQQLRHLFSRTYNPPRPRTHSPPPVFSRSDTVTRCLFCTTVWIYLEVYISDM